LKVLIFSVLITFIDQATKLSLKGLSIPFLNFQQQGLLQGQKIFVANVFNIANAAITLGTVFFILSYRKQISCEDVQPQIAENILEESRE
jgi:hypothetical protein